MTFYRIWRAYNKLLGKHPYLMQAIQTGILVGSGDFLAQKIISQSTDYDYPRTLRFFSLGLIIGPVVHKWLVTLDKIFECDKTFSTTLKKMLLDQLCFSPIAMGIFLTSITLMEGGDIHYKLAHAYPDILINSYKLWPALQIINFTFIPLRFRVFFIQFFALGWNTYLAWRITYVEGNSIKKSDMQENKKVKRKDDQMAKKKENIKK